MKSLDVKKIAAVIAGVGLLGASVALAGPTTVDNVNIVTDQGVPAAQIVVGSGAAASDGVAAANIAAVIGSLAYASKKVSASLVGSPTCTATVEAGEGTCEITAGSEQATVEFSVPGGVTIKDAFEFKSYIYGFVDIDDTDDQADDGTANPKQIDETDFSPFADLTMTDTYVGKYTEEQKLLVLGDNDAPSFKTKDNVYRIKPRSLKYVVTFDSDDWNGLPYCIDKDNMTAGTGCDAGDEIEAKRVKITFLNEEWIISDMANGSYIKLAKESVARQVVKYGQNLSVGEKYSVEVSDFDWAAAQAGDSIATLNIYDKATGAKMADPFDIEGGQTKEVELTDGTTMSVHAYSVKIFTIAPETSYAELAIYAQEIKLEDGEEVDTSENKNWTVNLAWTDYEASNNSVLTQINLTRTTFDYVLEGESVNIIEDPANFQLLFSGRKGVSTDTLVVTGPKDEAVAKVSYKLEVDGTDYEVGGASEYEFIVLDADETKAFDVDGTGNIDATDKIYFGIGKNPLVYWDRSKEQRIIYRPASTLSAISPTNITVDVWNGTAWASQSNVNVTLTPLYGDGGTAGSNLYVNYTYWLENRSNETVLYNITATNDSTNVPTGLWAINASGTISALNASEENYDKYYELKNANLLYKINKDSSDDRNVSFDNTSTTATLRIYEEAGKDTAYPVSFGVEVVGTELQAIKGTSDDEVTYYDVAGTDTDYDVGFISQRGSTFSAVTDKEKYTFKMAKELDELQYFLKTPEMAEAVVGVVTQTMAVDDSYTADSVTTTIKGITATCGACTVAAGEAQCTADVKAVPTLDGAEVAANTTVSTPWQMTSADNMVILDTDATTKDVLILVGGQFVNLETKKALEGTAVSIASPGDMVCKAVSDKKIVVAGYTAADTTAASKEFIKKLLGETLTGVC